MMPYYADVKGAPQNSIIGGATLWVLSGKPEDEYKGVAKFFSYLSSPEVQSKWHMQTGYVPITKAAYQHTRAQGFYDKFPGRDVAVKQLNLKTADRQFQGPAHRQLRPDPRRRWTRSSRRCGPAEDAKQALDDGREARQQAACRLRARQQVARWQEGRPSVAAGGLSLFPRHDKARHLSDQAAALSAGRAADRDHAGLLLLAGGAGGLAVGAASRTPFGGNAEFVWLENFAASLQRPELPRLVRASRRCSALLVAVARARDLAAAGGDGRPRHPRRGRLQDLADLALRRGAGGGRRAVALPVQPRRSASSPMLLRGIGYRVELRAQRRPGDGRWSSSPRSGSRSATISCSSSPGCSRSRSR